MTNERILEYLMLDKILEHSECRLSEELYDTLEERRVYLEDKFINEYKPTVPIIKDPVKDDIAKEE